MGENQPVEGHRWNSQANRFLSALGWKQLGDSRIDVIGKDKQKYGLDSVFYYDDPLRDGSKEGFFIEAKRYAWDGATPSEMQKWYDDLLESLQQLPRTPDFLEKFSPPQNTRFRSGMLIIWHHDNYRHETFQQRLLKIQVPRRRSSKNIFAISNWTILRISAVLDEFRRISSENDVKEVEFFFPHRATSRPVQGMTIPIEYFVSKYLFITVKRIITLDDITKPREDKIIFYFGHLDRQSLEFVHQVANELQIVNSPIVIYCSENVQEHRSQIEDFRRLYGHYEIRQLNIGTQVPEWIVRDA